MAVKEEYLRNYVLDSHASHAKVECDNGGEKGKAKKESKRMNAMKIIYGLLISGCICIQEVSGSYLKGSQLYYGNASSSFITRWSFQEMCDHVFDTGTSFRDMPTTTKPGGITFDPARVKAGDLIFVRKLDLFMKTMHPRITVPYIMLSHGDFLDTTQEDNLRYLDDEKIIAWFSIHPPKGSHPKYYPIPLGVYQNKREIYQAKGRYAQLFQNLRNKPKTKLLIGTFDLDPVNNERFRVNKIFLKKPFYSPFPGRLSFDRYMEYLASGVFTLSPRGWGPDCYRTWEALLVGTIPIVKRGQYGILDSVRAKLRNGFLVGGQVIRAQLDRLYEHLPILVIDEWEEITEEFLEKKYKEITSRKYNIELLYIEYWRTVIGTVKEEYFKNYREELHPSH